MNTYRYVHSDPYLQPYLDIIKKRIGHAKETVQELLPPEKSLTDFANGQAYFGRHQAGNSWIFREWAPNATGIQLVGDRMGWDNRNPEFAFKKQVGDFWELTIDTAELSHLDLYKLVVSWPGGQGYRLSPWTKRVVQDATTKLFAEQVWLPEKDFEWQNPTPGIPPAESLLIYEAHIGMSSEKEKVNSYTDFRETVLPYIANSGYNVIQLMAIQEHPYYGSFGYHVSNFFAPSSRFGTPEELKMLIDAAHGFGLRVIIDLVHSHAVKNTLEGPGDFDGSGEMFFHQDHRRVHPAWDSLCFNYHKPETIHFLLSNCKYWLEEFKIDGYRFDGVTSMLYYDHGLERSFTSYDAYFDQGVDEAALSYLILANDLIKQVNKHAITIAEDMSGMPGLAIPVEGGGIGFDFRLAMGIPDFWIRLIKEQPDENWNVNQMYYELTNSRADERVISYAESHDQALVGDKTLIFRLADQEMYTQMSVHSSSLVIDRALALHKMIRLATLCTHGGGYLNFMGNEFGHPEWIDFPREGNNWSYTYAKRQWHLAQDENLRYRFLLTFDQDMISLFKMNENLAKNKPHKLLANEVDQVLAVQRGEYIFIFNFNPTQSFTGYGIPSPPADYQIIISSDQLDYGGFNRIDPQIPLESEPIVHGSGAYQLMAYLPSRTALIVKRIPTPRIH